MRKLKAARTSASSDSGMSDDPAEREAVEHAEGEAHGERRRTGDRRTRDGNKAWNRSIVASPKRRSTSHEALEERRRPTRAATASSSQASNEGPKHSDQSSSKASAGVRRSGGRASNAAGTPPGGGPAGARWRPAPGLPWSGSGAPARLGTPRRDARPRWCWCPPSPARPGSRWWRRGAGLAWPRPVRPWSIGGRGPGRTRPQYGRSVPHSQACMEPAPSAARAARTSVSLRGSPVVSKRRSFIT